MLDQLSFQQQCYQQLIRLFEQSKRGRSDALQKGRVEGFIYAGECLGLIDKSTSNALMERAHWEVYGETIRARQARKDALASGDEKWLETPAIERRAQLEKLNELNELNPNET